MYLSLYFVTEQKKTAIKYIKLNKLFNLNFY